MAYSPLKGSLANAREGTRFPLRCGICLNAIIRCVSGEENCVKRRLLTAILIAVVAGPGLGHAQLRGHGGPVKALAVSPDGGAAISGSFDTSAILWSISRNAA